MFAILSAQEITPDIEEFGDFHMRIRLETVTLFDNVTYAKLRTIPINQEVNILK
jgi:hypothetical protein